MHTQITLLLIKVYTICLLEEQSDQGLHCLPPQGAVWSRSTLFASWRSSLIRVYTVCHFVCIFWMPQCVLKSSFSNFQIIWAIISVVPMSRRMTKPIKWPVHPGKTQISLDICPVWPVFTVRMKKAWVLSYPWVHSEDWSDWVDAQADLSLCWAHRTFCWFCHEVSHIYNIYDNPTCSMRA